VSGQSSAVQTVSSKFFFGIRLPTGAEGALSGLLDRIVRLTRSAALRRIQPVVAKTIRRRFLAVPGRLTRSARRLHLHLPSRWPWRTAFDRALTRIRALPTTI
jgi:hypothetical protein